MNTVLSIQKTLVLGHKRAAILPRYAGDHYLSLEATIYGVMGSLCPLYNGGYWQMFELNNGTFFMVPEGFDEIDVTVEGNYFSRTLSAEAAGIVACLMAFNRMAWRTRDERFNDLFYCLRDFAGEHKEAGAIFAAID